MGISRHFVAHPVEYAAWRNLRSRCSNAKHPGFRFYGARGISCCVEWTSFERFFEDVGPRPSPKHSIERKDNDGNYEPSNVRWATTKEQARNRRNNRRITAGGETLVVTDWAGRLGTRVGTIVHRIARGWTEAEAVTTPLGERPERILAAPKALRAYTGRIIEHNGDRMNVADWARRLGITREGLRQRILRGVPLEIALCTPHGGYRRLPRPKRGPNWPWKTKPTGEVLPHPPAGI